MQPDEIAELRAELARVTEERDAYRIRVEQLDPPGEPALRVFLDPRGIVLLRLPGPTETVGLSPLKARELGAALANAARRADAMRKKAAKARRHMH